MSHFARVSNTHHTPILNVLQNKTFNKFHPFRPARHNVNHSGCLRYTLLNDDSSVSAHSTDDYRCGPRPSYNRAGGTAIHVHYKYRLGLVGSVFFYSVISAKFMQAMTSQRELEKKVSSNLYGAKDFKS